MIKLTAERQYIDRNGYVKGQYFGVGAPLYHVVAASKEDGFIDSMMVRAPDAKTAKQIAKNTWTRGYFSKVRF